MKYIVLLVLMLIYVLGFTKRQIGKGIPTMGRVQIFTGDGYGKTMAALGEALIAAASGKRVVVIQFLKGRGLTDSTFERQLEPEIKIFRFEKSDADFLSLPEDKQREEAQNIRNGICFARKVLTTFSELLERSRTQEPRGEYVLVIWGRRNWFA